MSPTSEALTDSLLSSRSPPSPMPIPSHMTNSTDSLPPRPRMPSPQTIPESQKVDHSIDEPLTSLPPSLTSNGALAEALQATSLTRNESTRSRTGRTARMSSSSRRQSRRSTSYTSASPAHAFLSSWHRETSTDAPIEIKPDDEGQPFGLKNEYIIGRTINSGGFGVVKEVRTMHEKTGREQTFAVKIVRRQSHHGNDIANETAQQDLEHEVSVWRHLKHGNILELLAVYETEYATFCVMDLNEGGTLFDLVRKNRQSASSGDGASNKGLAPRLAKHYAFQLASALRYLHEDIRVCHRDVKLENCLIDSTVPDYEVSGGNLRLCDFGLADFLHSSSIDGGPEPFVDAEDSSAPASRSSRHNTTSSVIGTLEYASPKGLSVNRKLFETAGDVWAYGVIVYALCTGDLPFRHPMPSKTVDAILRADWDDTALRQASASGVGEEVTELVRGCLEKDIDLRWTIGDCMNTPWFADMDKEGETRHAVW